MQSEQVQLKWLLLVILPVAPSACGSRNLHKRRQRIVLEFIQDCVIVLLRERIIRLRLIHLEPQSHRCSDSCIMLPSSSHQCSVELIWFGTKLVYQPCTCLLRGFVVVFFFLLDDILKHNSLQDACLLNYIFIWYFLRSLVAKAVSVWLAKFIPSASSQWMTGSSVCELWEEWSNGMLQDLFTCFAVLLKVCLWVMWKWSTTFKNMTVKLYRVSADYSATRKTSVLVFKASLGADVIVLWYKPVFVQASEFSAIARQILKRMSTDVNAFGIKFSSGFPVHV